MASLLEFNFYTAVAAADGVRQSAYAAALTTYGYVAANLAAYKTALIAADVAYITAINSAASTAGITPNVVPDFPGNFGPSAWATIAS